jgi:glycosyltransferase involved in cell wall biosynthesis
MMTIVIPTYQQAAFLGEAIESALKQTIPCEVIVVNDGSTDDTQEVAERYPVKVIHQVNKGLASARNTGIMNASDDYILFLDSDDILEPNCVEKILEVFNTTDADVVAASFRTFGTSDETVILMSNPTIDDFKVANRAGYCAAFKKSVLLEVGGYSPRMTYGYEDLHLWFDLLSRGKKLITLPDILWNYRTKEHSMIHDAQEHHEELMTQIKKDFAI